MSHEPEPVLEWRKSTVSTTNGSCVQLAPLPGGGVAVRDSKDPDGPVLRFTEREWTAFVAALENGEFNFAEQVAKQRQDPPDMVISVEVRWPRIHPHA
jgi:hypothetical protein